MAAAGVARDGRVDAAARPRRRPPGPRATRPRPTTRRDADEAPRPTSRRCARRGARGRASARGDRHRRPVARARPGPPRRRASGDERQVRDPALLDDLRAAAGDRRAAGSRARSAFTRPRLDAAGELLEANVRPGARRSTRCSSHWPRPAVSRRASRRRPRGPDRSRRRRPRPRAGRRLPLLRRPRGAVELGLVGWVANEPTAASACVAGGPAAALDALEAALERGPAGRDRRARSTRSGCRRPAGSTRFAVRSARHIAATDARSDAAPVGARRCTGEPPDAVRDLRRRRRDDLAYSARARAAASSSVMESRPSPAPRPPTEPARLARRGSARAVSGDPRPRRRARAASASAREAGRIRVAATRAYSSAWDEAGRRQPARAARPGPTGRSRGERAAATGRLGLRRRSGPPSLTSGALTPRSRRSHAAATPALVFGRGSQHDRRRRRRARRRTAAYDALARAGRGRRGRVVVRQRPRRRLAGAARRGRPSPRRRAGGARRRGRGGRPRRRRGRARSTTRTGRSTGCRRFPQVAPDRPRRAAVSARSRTPPPDARAVVYAGIQADPLVARAAALLADAVARPADPRPGRDERRCRPTPPRGGRCSRRCSGRHAPAGPGARPDARRSSTASLAVAERGEQVRSQFRGAIVESLTELLVRRRPGRGRRGRWPSGASGGSSSTASAPRSIPYDVTVEADGAAEAIDCKWGARGISADVLHQLDDARTHAADEDERLAATLVVFDAAPIVRRPARARRPRPTRRRGSSPRDARPARRAMTTPASRRDRARRRRPAGLARPLPGPVRRGRARTACSGRRASCATPRTSPGSTRRPSAFGRDVVRRARPDLARPGRRARGSSRAVPMGTTLTRSNARRRRCAGSSPGAAASSGSPTGRSPAGSTPTGS